MIKCNILKFYLTGPFILFCMFSWHISALGKIYIYFISNNSKDQEAKLRCSIIELVLISVKYLAIVCIFTLRQVVEILFDLLIKEKNTPNLPLKAKWGMWLIFFFNLFFTYILQTLIIIIGILARDYSVGSIIDLIQLKIDTNLLKITVCIYLHQN